MEEDEKKLYVGNLPYELDDEELRKVFEDQGFVVEELFIIKDKVTGQGRGFGFVSLVSKDQVESAISELNGCKIKEREIKIAKAIPRENH